MASLQKKEIETVYLAQPTGASFPAVGRSALEITAEKHRAYFIVGEEGANVERERLSSRHPECLWRVVKVEQSHSDGFIVVGQARA